jgi:hypothetical protein
MMYRSSLVVGFGVLFASVVLVAGSSSAVPTGTTVAPPATTTTTTTTAPAPVATATRITTAATARAVPTRTTPATTVPRFPVAFKAFDCGWVTAELELRNVQPQWVAWMTNKASQESHCCPHIQGQDRTDADCNVTHVAKGPPFHRSDTGAFMLNGVHYKTTAGIFCPELTCSQSVLLADVGMQFDAMLMLLELCGKRPWTGPSYGCAAPAGGIYVVAS